MRLVIDGDACPDIFEMNELAKKYQVPVLLFHDFSHQVEIDYAKLIPCDVGYQSVDMKIMEEIKIGDILVTQDYGLAVLALIRKIYVIHPMGFFYDSANIDSLILSSYNSAKLRRRGIFTKGSKKRTRENREELLSSLEKIFKEC